MAYVGQTNDLPGRLATHQRTPPRHMKSAVQQYTPWDTHFKVETLMVRRAGSLADRAETQLIKLHNTLHPAGYNTLSGPPRTDARYHAMAQQRKRKQHG